MRVAGLQFDIAWEDVEANVVAATEAAARAAGDGARLVVLPEMFATGFTMDSALAVSAFDRSHEAAAEMARRHGIWVAAGMVEAGEGRPRNCCVIFDPGGLEVLRYRKIHPFSLAGEHEHYDGGEQLETLVVEELRVTPLVCYDLRFSEPFRAAAVDTDLFLVIANWPEKRAHAWSTLLVSRAIENQCYVLGVNRVGEADGLTHSGDSALVGPLGETLDERSETAGVVIGDVSADTVSDVRGRFGFLADRRPEIYDRIARARRR